LYQLETDLRRIPLFAELDDQEISKIKASTVTHSYQRKSNVFMEGEARTAVFFIRKGVVKTYKIDINGNEQIVSFLKEGDMFPHVGFFDQTPYPATAEVLEDAELLVIPIKAFEQAILEMPTIAIKVMRVMGTKLKELQAKLQDFTAQDVNHRIVSYLCRLAKEHGKQVEDSIEIDLRITHQEFASLVGSTRETVTRVFNQLKKEKILSVDRKKITILDLDALESGV